MNKLAGIEILPPPLKLIDPPLLFCGEQDCWFMHVENCPDCFGFGMGYVDYGHAFVVRASEAWEYVTAGRLPRSASEFKACPTCGSMLRPAHIQGVKP